MRFKATTTQAGSCSLQWLEYQRKKFLPERLEINREEKSQKDKPSKEGIPRLSLNYDQILDRFMNYIWIGNTPESPVESKKLEG